MARAYLARASRARHRAGVMPAIFWTALAAGILLKGPLILMVVGLAAAARSPSPTARRAGCCALRPLRRRALGAAPGAAVVRGDHGARRRQLLRRNRSARTCSPRSFQGQETHGAPPGYYLLLFWLTFWPAAPLAAMAAPAVWRQRREPAARFLLAWLVPSWIVFELVVTKLPHYVLPLYPAIAILIARAIERRALSQNAHLARAAT